jgi:PelA/Pel-15E family pectate lyase
MKILHYLASLLFLAAVHGASASPSSLLDKPDSWFGSDEGRKTTANILSWQSAYGSWPKNKDITKNPYSGDRKRIKGTFDNKATTDELRYLARAFRATGDKACLDAFLLGSDHVIGAQYPNGGWPQYFPLSEKYHRHITFNDGTMVRLLELLREISTDESYAFVDARRRDSAKLAFRKGIDCILKCQIVVKGKPTVWCAQHDEVSLAPATARAYELPSLSGSESAGILRFLMSLENPSPEVIRSVKMGVAWFDSAKIEGIRIEKVSGDRQAIKDPRAVPLWARFYDLETSQAFFCDRDGVKKASLSEIGKERRNGYAWYGNWGDAVAKAFAKWPHR